MEIIEINGEKFVRLASVQSLMKNTLTALTTDIEKLVTAKKNHEETYVTNPAFEAWVEQAGITREKLLSRGKSAKEYYENYCAQMAGYPGECLIGHLTTFYRTITAKFNVRKKQSTGGSYVFYSDKAVR